MIDWLKESIFCVYIFHGWIFLIKGLYIHEGGEKPKKVQFSEATLPHSKLYLKCFFSKVAAQKVLWSEENTYFKNCSILKLHSAFLCWNQKESVSRFFFLKMLGQTASLSAGLAALREISGLIYALSSFQSQHSNVKCELKIKG